MSTTQAPKRRPLPADEVGPWRGPVAAGEYLGLSKAMIYQLMNTGDIRFSRVGNRRRISESELNDFMLRQRSA
jgi:excisionase family DNA binding protein